MYNGLYTVYNTVETTIVPLDSESRSVFFFCAPFPSSNVNEKKLLNEIEIKADCTSSYSADPTVFPRFDASLQ